MDLRVSIGSRKLGPGQPALLVAELSGNHNGSLARALQIVRAAAAAGADAVKLQTYTPDTITIDCASPDFIVPGGGPWGGRTLYDLYSEAHTPWEWHEALFAEARDLGMEMFSTPFDETAVDLLESLNAPAYKIASFELIDDALLRVVAKTRKPVVLSTGMATREEIGHAVEVLREAGVADLIVLKCTSSYPASDDAMNLLTIPALAETTGCLVGLSDHSTGHLAPVVAVSLGACLVEKHFTLRRSDGGVDSHFSLEPAEFKEMVREVRRAEAMGGRAAFGPGVAEEGSIVFRRSLYVVENVEAGERFTVTNVRSIRPGFGLAPRFLDAVIGKVAVRDVVRGTPLAWPLVKDPV